MERQLSKIVKLVLFLAVLWSLNAPVVLAKDEFKKGTIPDLFGPNCHEYLLPEPKQYFSEKVHLISRFHKFRIGARPDFGGFYVEPMATKHPPVVRTVVLPLDEPLIRVESWEIPNIRRLYFVSAGFRNLESDSQKINATVADHVMNHFGEALQIVFDRKRSREEKRLHNFRWNAHDAVMEVYAKKKDYLEPEDFAKLIAYNQHSSHNDVFGLMYSHPMLMSDISYEDIGHELAMTIQVSYYGSRNFLEPSLKGVLAARGFGYFEDQDRLGFEFLIPDHKLVQFRSEFYSEFEAKSTCEMTRYLNQYRRGRALAMFPTGFQSLFLKRALGTAKTEGMKTIVAVGDKDTMILWQRYGFKLWRQLPIDGEPEFLLYLKTDSPEYSAFYNRLEAASQDVKVTTLR